jgi:hypothetical protein
MIPQNAKKSDLGFAFGGQVMPGKALACSPNFNKAPGTSTQDALGAFLFNTAVSITKAYAQNMKTVNSPVGDNSAVAERPSEDAR